MTNIYNLTPAQLSSQIKEWKVPAFRTKQLIKWLYEQRVTSFDEMGNLPKNLRVKLEENYSIYQPKIISIQKSLTDSAVKFAMELSDGEIIESVILFSKKRRTLCLSSQVGCGLACSFCETGKLGLVRNLETAEIISQIITASNLLANDGERVSNLVFMGMGEALSNFENFKTAIEIINDENCFAIGNRKITVSTAGVVPSIKKMINANMAIELAISLNSSSDTERDELMPINKKYPISELLEAAREYANFRGRPVTFEYVLVKGKNDSAEAAQRLIKLFRNYPAKINLIPLNDCTTEGLTRPGVNAIDKFSQLLHKGGLTITIRRSGGQDIDGACGQLAGKLRKEGGRDAKN
jgi:23S rRNA (adenine2503-C2)-methyltransferase